VALAVGKKKTSGGNFLAVDSDRCPNKTNATNTAG
jgi:hypothetical protein